MKGFEKMKKVLAVLLAATMLFGMASCSSGNGNSSEAGSSAGSSAESGESIPESSSGDVKIKVTTSANSGRPGLEAVAPLFEEETGIAVEAGFADLGTSTFTAELMTQLQAGSAPDIFTAYVGTGTSSPNIGTLASEGYLMDLSDTDYGKSVVGSAVEDCVSVDGKVYSALFGLQFCCIIYNEDLFEQYSLTPASTWEELIALIGKIREVAPDKIPIAFGGGNTSIAMIVASMFACNQPDYTGDEESFADSQVWKDGLNMIQELTDAGAYNTSASRSVSAQSTAAPLTRSCMASACCVQYKTSAVPRRSISKRSALPTGSEARYSAAVTIRPPLIRIKQGKPSGRERSAPLRARAAVCRFFAPSYRFVPLKISTSVAGRSLLKLCSSRRRFPQRQVSSPLASRGM